MTRTNLLTNPSFELDAAGWTPTPGRWSGSDIDGGIYAYGTDSLSTKVPATAGLSYAGSGWFVRTTSTTRSCAVSVHFYDAADVELDAPTVTLTLLMATDVPERRSSVRIAPANTTQVALKFWTSTSSTVLEMDNFLLEQSDTVGDYFDGSTNDLIDFECAWTGTPHASTSTQEPHTGGRTNLILNPDAEVDTTGWTATSGVLTRATNRWVNGVASFQFVPTNPSSARAAMASYTVTGLTVGATYSLSMFLQRYLGSPGNVQMFVNDGGTYTYGSAVGSNWNTVSMTFVAANTSVTLGITNESAISSSTGFVFDTVTLVQGNYGVPFSPYTPAANGITYLADGDVNNSTTTTGTGRVNLLKNPSFEDGTKYGWNGTVDSGSTVIDSTVALYGTNSLKSTATGAAHRVRGTNGAGLQAEMVPVVPGRRYTFTVWAKSSPSISTFYLYVGGANASGVFTASYAEGAGQNTSTTGFVRNMVSFTAVAGDAYVYPAIRVLASSGYSYWFDGCMIEETGGNSTIGLVPAFFDGDTRTSTLTHAWTGTELSSTSTQYPGAPTDGTLVTVKSYESGAWVSRVAVPKARSSSGTWIVGNPKRWNGTAWVEMT